MKIETLHQLFLESSGICTDTRKISNNCLFFALKGDNFNGNEFAHEALEKGAFKVVIDSIAFHKNSGETIMTSNALKKLQELATYHRKYLGLPIIGLTGSNGKTTTKELINAVLSKKFKTVATRGNLNNHIGVPLTLLSMDRETEMGIVEMGANHPKEIAALCDIALPDYGYITNFGKAHLEGFGNLEGVIKAKSELYKHLLDNDKLVFVNANDETQVKQTKALSKYTFGNEEQDCYIALKDATEFVIAQVDGTTVNSNLIGQYNFHNIAAALAIGTYFEVAAREMKDAIEAYFPIDNRSQIIERGSNKVVLDAYNANPTSMMAAIDTFLSGPAGNKLLILGDMFELGNSAAEEHQAIADHLAGFTDATVYLVGGNFHGVDISADNITLFPNFDALSAHLKLHLPANSAILVKGSRGMALERVLDVLD